MTQSSMSVASARWRATRSPRTPGSVASARSDDKLKSRRNSLLDCFQLHARLIEKEEHQSEDDRGAPELTELRAGGGRRTGIGSRVAAAAVAIVPTHATSISRRRDLIARYGTAAVMGISSVATMSGPDGSIKELPTMTAVPARAITVTAASTRPSARIRRGHSNEQHSESRDHDRHRPVAPVAIRDRLRGQQRRHDRRHAGQDIQGPPDLVALGRFVRTEGRSLHSSTLCSSK